MEEEFEEYEEYEEVIVEEVEADDAGNDEDFGDDDADFGADDDDFGDDDDDFGADDDGDGWDDDVEEQADAYIPLTVADVGDDSSEEYEIDKDGNIITTPSMRTLERQKSLSKQKSQDNQCWKCSGCGAINKLSWTLTVEQFLHKCCICKQSTYEPTTEVFESETWDEPSNDHWECDRCTFHNPIGRNDCSVCQHPHHKVLQEEMSDDSTNGDSQFQRYQPSPPPPKNTMGGAMGGGMGWDPMDLGSGISGFGSGFGKSSMPRRSMGTDFDFGANRRRGGVSMGGHNGGRRSKKRAPRDTKPVSKAMERNLRNLLILGFIRAHSIALPTKFFDILNKFYSAFDRWDWDMLRSQWTTKTKDIVTIKRVGKDKAVWKNMYALNAISYETRKATESETWTKANPSRYSWTLRLLDRLQMESEKEAPSGDATTDITEQPAVAQDKKEKESFEIQYMDVVVGVVDAEQMPQKALSNAFHISACGYGMFAGNGKVYDRKTESWIRACHRIQHGDTVTVSIEWMKREEFESMYGSGKDEDGDENMKEEPSNGHSPLDDEWVVALSFARNVNAEEKGNEKPLKGSVLCLPSSTSYKLAVSAALRRWEIEWVSSQWTESLQDLPMKEAIGREH